MTQIEFGFPSPPLFLDKEVSWTPFSAADPGTLDARPIAGREEDIHENVRFAGISSVASEDNPRVAHSFFSPLFLPRVRDHRLVSRFPVSLFRINLLLLSESSARRDLE